LPNIHLHASAGVVTVANKKETIMPTFALYDTLFNFKDIHKVVLNFAEELTDEQLNWKPEGYSTSIGFHLWHLARESDYLKAALLHHYPGLGLGLNDESEIWVSQDLAQKWGFPMEAHETVGTGLSDKVAAGLPIPQKAELLAYLRNSYQALEQFVELLDTKYSTFGSLNEDLTKKIQGVRVNLLVFLTHDCRHLGMMECLKGLQTGFGSATEKRKA
jgi:hypothetical protein